MPLRRAPADQLAAAAGEASRRSGCDLGPLAASQPPLIGAPLAHDAAAAWEKRWHKSSWKEKDGSAGKFTWTAGKWFGDEAADKGIQTGPDSKYFALYSELKKPFTNEKKDLVLQARASRAALRMLPRCRASPPHSLRERPPCVLHAARQPLTALPAAPCGTLHAAISCPSA